MADYHCQFVTIVENITADEKKFIQEYRSGVKPEQIPEDKVSDDEMFQMGCNHVLFYDPESQMSIEADENGDPGAALLMLHLLFKYMRSDGDDRIEMQWAYTCSSMREDGFSGGCGIATKEGYKVICTDSIVSKMQITDRS
jgi:hypothetical protein